MQKKSAFSAEKYYVRVFVLALGETDAKSLRLPPASEAVYFSQIGKFLDAARTDAPELIFADASLFRGRFFSLDDLLAEQKISAPVIYFSPGNKGGGSDKAAKNQSDFDKEFFSQKDARLSKKNRSLLEYLYLSDRAVSQRRILCDFEKRQEPFSPGALSVAISRIRRFLRASGKSKMDIVKEGSRYHLVAI